MNQTTPLGNSEIVSSLTPCGLGRLIAAMGGRPEDNPYADGTPQHADWLEGFQDVLALQRLDFLNRLENTLPPVALNG